MNLAPLDYTKGAALVTGGTSGIGKEIALELVRRGTEKIVIVAQDQEKLDRTAIELRGLDPDLEVHTIVIDLSQHGAAGEIRKNVDAISWNVEILVNNAGLARKYIFAEDPATDPSLKMIDVMARALVDMSLHFLPDMVERRRGGILNLGSTAGYAAVPYTSAYAASKAFVISFSQAIREENRDNGVRIACIVPGVTQTNLDGDGHGERRGVLDLVGIDDPADVAKGAVDVFEANDAAKIFGWNNKILQFAQDLLPKSTNARLIAKSRGAPGEE